MGERDEGKAKGKDKDGNNNDGVVTTGVTSTATDS